MLSLLIGHWGNYSSCKQKFCPAVKKIPTLWLHWWPHLTKHQLSLFACCQICSLHCVVRICILCREWESPRIVSPFATLNSSRDVDTMEIPRGKYKCNTQTALFESDNHIFYFQLTCSSCLTMYMTCNIYLWMMMTLVGITACLNYRLKAVICQRI